MGNKRVKNVTFVLYPESGFEFGALTDYINRTGYRCAISPLHAADEQDIKPHYHVVIALSSPRELTSLNEEFNSVCTGKCTQLFNVGSLSSITRYLTHMDNPEKEQFNEKPRIYNGYEYDRLIFKKMTDADVSNAVYLLSCYMLEGVTSYADLILQASVNGQFDFVEYCISHSYAVNAFVTSYKKDVKYKGGNKNAD